MDGQILGTIPNQPAVSFTMEQVSEWLWCLDNKPTTIQVKISEDWFGESRDDKLTAPLGMRQRLFEWFPTVEIECTLPTDLLRHRTLWRANNHRQWYLSDMLRP